MRAADALQVPFVDLLYGDLSPFATKTRFGVAFVAMTLGLRDRHRALVLLAWMLDRPRLLWPAFLVALGFASGLSLSGHQGVEPNSTFLTELADWLHLVAGDPLGRRPRRARGRASGRSRRRCGAARSSASPGSRPSSSACSSLAGTYLSISRLPALSDLWTTDYGHALLVKIAIVCVALSWGAVAPLLRAATARARRDCRGRCGAACIGESMVAMLVLLAAAVLVNGARRRPTPAARGSATRALHVRAGLPCARELVAISGGAGFLGLHLARRLVADGHTVRTLDLAPLDDRELERRRRGDARRRPLPSATCARSSTARTSLVHAAAALPIQARAQRSARSTSRAPRTCSRGALEAGVRRVVLISSTAVYGVPERHPIVEDDPLVGVGWYGESKIEAERSAGEFGRRGLDVVIVRPKTFIGPERLGVFEILFDWIREGRRIPILGDGGNLYQLLAVEDLVDAVVRSLRRAGRRPGAERRRGDVRHRARRPRRR